MLFSNIIVVLSLLFVSICSGSKLLIGSSVSASIRDTPVAGYEGLNLNLDIPFQFQDYRFGARIPLGNLQNIPIPQSAYVGKTFETMGDGFLKVDAQYLPINKQGMLSTSWISSKLGLQVGMKGDSKDYVTEVSISKEGVVGEKIPVSVSAAYDVVNKVVAGVAQVRFNEAVVEIMAQSDSQDPVVSVTRAIDANNEVTPSISLKTAKSSIAWRRSWVGGSLLTKMHPFAEEKKVEVVWTDEGVHGQWVTRADVPLEDASKLKISVSRTWAQ